jgi:hypothetical protein
VLGPARSWGGFGALDVRLRLPRGWTAATTPALRREGEALVGHWNGIPADAIAISVRAPEPNARVRYWLVVAAALLALAGLARLGRSLGQSLGARRQSGAWAGLAAVAAAVILGFATMLAWLLVPEWVAWSAGPMVNRFEISRLSYGGGFALILVLPAVLLAGFLAVLLPAIWAARRSRANP